MVANSSPERPDRAWWMALGGRNALSVWSWVLPTLAAVAFTAVFEVPAFGFRLWPRIALVLAVQVVLIPLLVAGHALLSRSGHPRPWLGIAVFVTLGIARAVAVDVLAPVIEPVARDSLRYQIALNVTYALLTLPFIAIVVDSIRNYRALRARVRDEGLRWQRALGEAEIAFAREYAEYRQKVDSEVMARVIQLQDDIAAQAREAADSGAVSGADELRRLSAEVVRPLSHELMLQPTAIRISPDSFISSPPAWEARDVLRDASRAPTAGHWGVCAVMGLLGLVGLSLYASPSLLIINLGWDLFIFGVVPSLAARTMPGVAGKPPLPVAWAWTASAFVWSALAVIGVLGTAALMHVFVGAGTVFWGAAILYCALSAVSVIALTGFRRERQLEDDLVDLLSRQEALASRLMLRIDHERRELGLVLHGSVQASLTRAAVVLDRWGEGKDLDALPAVLTEVRSALDAVVGAFDVGNPLSSGLDDVVRDRLRLWAGAVDCSWSVMPEAAAAIDGAVAKEIGDIVGEAVTNAVRHGRAEEVIVDVRLDGDAVEVRVRDNGSGPVAARHPGAGLGLLARAGIPWTLERLGSWTELCVRVPALPAAPPATRTDGRVT